MTTLTELWNAIEPLTDFERSSVMEFLGSHIDHEAGRRRICTLIARETKLSAFDSPIKIQKYIENAIDRKLAEWKEFCNLPDPHVRRAEDHKKKKEELDCKLSARRSELSKVTNELDVAINQLHVTLRHHAAISSLPQVPNPQHAAFEVGEHQPYSGIYFAWNECRVVYVGRSINVPQRLRSHNVVNERWMVSTIQLPSHEIYFAELYYIWLLRPELNSEGRQTINATKQTQKGTV